MQKEPHKEVPWRTKMIAERNYGSRPVEVIMHPTNLIRFSLFRFLGLVVQRWVTCWIIFVVLWVAQMIVYWIKNDTL